MPAVNPMSMILSALRMIGEKRAGDTLNSAEQIDYLADLIACMSSWGLEPLNSYAVTVDTKALVAGTASYTIGSGGSIDTTRPKEIIGAFVRDSSSYDAPIRILDEEAYRRLSLKSTGNTYPTDLWYDKAFASGLATVYLYPAPSASLTLHLYSPKQLQTFTGINDTLVLPPGYQLMIESNFAIRCAAGYTKVSEETLKIARESKAAVQRANTPERHMRLDAGVTGSVDIHGSNIYTGP